MECTKYSLSNINKLPILVILGRIVLHVRVLHGRPGHGKTTLVPMRAAFPLYYNILCFYLFDPIIQSYKPVS